MKRWSLLALLCLLIVLPVSAQETADSIPDSLNEQMDDLVIATENLRGLDTLTPVERAFPTREETIAYLEKLYDEEFPPEAWAQLEAFYIALNLLPADVNLRSVYLDLLGSQIAGFYDTDTQIMNVLPVSGDDPGATLSFLEQIIFAHEYVHALQDQHFDLDSLMSTEEALTNPDRQLAITALVEGDATAIMNVFAQEVAMSNPLMAFSLLAEGALTGSLFVPQDIPASLLEELMFPYNGGNNFVVALYEAGGWDLINTAYTNLPQSTEQILHPEKYLDGELPLAVTLPDFTPDESWTQMWNAPLGEFYVRLHLNALDVESSDRDTAATGWGGDQFAVYENAAGELAWVIALEWDSPADMDEFTNVYTAARDAYFGASASDGCWSNNAEAVCLFTVDGQTRITGAPSLDTARALAGL